MDVIQGIDNFKTDLVELRLDYCNDLDGIDLQALEAFKDRLIITVRSGDEGGFRYIPQETRSKVLQSAIRRGFLVDIEISSPFLEDVEYGGQILSRHYIHRDPPLQELEDLAREYGDKCRVLKIALRKSENSSTNLISLLNRHHNIAVMETDGDPASRIIYSALGSRLLYCHMGEKTSPGQIGCNEAVKVLDLMKKME